VFSAAQLRDVLSNAGHVEVDQCWPLTSGNCGLILNRALLLTLLRG
jgi:hypothetical protein